jgi:hypothetical protein
MQRLLTLSSNIIINNYILLIAIVLNIFGFDKFSAYLQSGTCQIKKIMQIKEVDLEKQNRVIY